MKKIAETPPDSSAVDPFAIVLATILKHPLVQEALRAATAANVPPPALVAVGVVSKQEAARALSISVATLDRLLREPGAPFEVVGVSKKIDVTAFRAWLATRGKKPTRQRPEGAPDPIDVSSIAARAGLRLAGSGRP